MKKQLPAWAALAIIALIAGLLLGLTNELTAKRIDEQTLLAADAARKGVLRAAQAFVEETVTPGASVTSCYRGEANGAVVGYTAQVIVKGYGGDIEVTVGVDQTKAITGINVGGSSFAETAGLGAKTKEDAFTGQYAGKGVPVVLNKDVDAVSAATISSRAVNDGVNEAASYIISQFLS